MCLKSKQQLSPVVTTTTTTTTMQPKSGEEEPRKNEEASPPPRPPPRPPMKASYQNVTLASASTATSAATTNLFRLEELTTSTKKAASPLLSGGCVINMMTPENNVLHVHHHHHFYNNSNNNQQQQLSNIHEILSINRFRLEQSGWYHGRLNWCESAHLLRNAAEGAFLVRDSADSRFLYTLSVQRGIEEGPTSVRIHFAFGKFRLDADEKIEHLMPSFDSVVDLVEHYCKLSVSNMAKSHVWVDNSGQLYSPICLKKPLLKAVPSLAHSARLVVNRTHAKSHRHNLIGLPNRLKQYLLDYPHNMWRSRFLIKIVLLYFIQIDVVYLLMTVCFCFPTENILFGKLQSLKFCSTARFFMHCIQLLPHEPCDKLLRITLRKRAPWRESS